MTDQEMLATCHGFIQRTIETLNAARVLRAHDCGALAHDLTERLCEDAYALERDLSEHYDDTAGPVLSKVG